MRVHALRLRVIVSAFLVSCGNTVSVSHGGAGGGGAAAAGTTGHGSESSASFEPTEKTSSYASTSAGMIDPQLCDKICAAVGDVCYGDCQATCKSYLLPPCASQGAMLVACLTENYNQTTCQPNPYACSSELLLMCRSTVPPKCELPTCGSSQSTCACSDACDGGTEKAVCDFAGDAAACTCFLNDLEVASCEESGDITNACDLKAGCCGAYFD